MLRRFLLAGAISAALIGGAFAQAAPAATGFTGVVLGTGTSQPCVVTFAQPFNLPPSCVVAAESYTLSSSLVDGVRVSWSCISRAGGG